MPKWYDVREIMPPQLKDVLVYNDGCYAITCAINLGDRMEFCYTGIGDPTHWTYLPDPPGGNEL